MKKFGLIGFPVSHSFSKTYFEKKFEAYSPGQYAYELFPLEHISGLKTLIGTEPELVGLNVTIPHKQAVMSLADEVHPIAARCGAANTLKIERSNNGCKIYAFNSDYTGFYTTLKNWLNGTKHQALVLGNGGAAKAVQAVLHDLEIPFLTVHRQPVQNGIIYSELGHEMIEQHTLIINTTPLGMYPHVQGLPGIPYEYIGSHHYLYDLVYNPIETSFLAEGNKRGAKTKNGLEMLYAQAEASWDFWENT